METRVEIFQFMLSQLIRQFKIRHYRAMVIMVIILEISLQMLNAKHVIEYIKTS
jgi:hypothetical protein